MNIESRRERTDLRNAALAATVACLLFFLLLILIDSYRVTGGASVRTPAAARIAGVEEIPRPYDIEQDGIPVLCHHFLRGKSSALQVVRILGALFLSLPLLDDMDVWTQTVGAFERQMRYLHDEGYQSIGLEDLVAWQNGRRKLPPKCVVITFDDGARSVELAAPILKRYGFKATLFVATGKIDTRWEGIETLDWEAIRELRESGIFSIQSHTHNLHYHVKTPKGRMPAFLAASAGFYEFEGAESWQRAVLDDLRESRRLIAKHLGEEPRFLAWPYGAANTELDSIAAAAGFDAACTLALGNNTPANAAQRPRDGFEVKRITITARTSPRAFSEMLVSGGRPQNVQNR